MVNVIVIVEQNGFLSLEQTEVFALDEIKFLKGIMVLGISLSGCSHTRKIIINSIKILWQEYLSHKECFPGFLLKNNFRDFRAFCVT